MKKFLSFAIAIVFSLGLSAQSSEVSHEANKRTAILATYVDLTDTQKTEIMQINESKLTEIESNRSNYKQSTRSRLTEILAVLTDAQKAVLETKTGRGSGVRPQY